MVSGLPYRVIFCNFGVAPETTVPASYLLPETDLGERNSPITLRARQAYYKLWPYDDIYREIVCFPR